jgi:uncharacterized membrane protein
MLALASLLPIFAQLHNPGSWDVVHIAIGVVIIAAIVGVVYIALRQFGVVPPAWFMQIIWIIVVAFVCVAAILILASMW